MLSAQLYKQRQRKFFLSSLSLGAGGREQSVIQRGTSSTSKAVSRKCENNNSSGVGGRIAYFVLYWSRLTNNKEILQMVKRLKLQFLGETSKNKPSNRDQNISQRKNVCTKRNLGFVEERSNNNCSKFKGSVCQQHHSKMVG